jgi:hypothetical protein
MMMPKRCSRSTLFGAWLSLVAVLGLFALSSWHNAVVHDDDPIHVVSVEHDHGLSKQTDPDRPIHVLAHATGQWIGFAVPFHTHAIFASADRVWAGSVYNLRGGIEPSELLRPPRG